MRMHPGTQIAVWERTDRNIRMVGSSLEIISPRSSALKVSGYPPSLMHPSRSQVTIHFHPPIRVLLMRQPTQPMKTTPTIVYSHQTQRIMPGPRTIFTVVTMTAMVMIVRRTGPEKLVIPDIYMSTQSMKEVAAACDPDGTAASQGSNFTYIGIGG